MISYVIRYIERDQDYSIVRLDAASPSSRIGSPTYPAEET